jgi:mono/diheme cytochrome c family protein
LALTVLVLGAASGCTWPDQGEGPPVQNAQQDQHEPAADPELVAAGRELVVRECATCHAIDNNLVSPKPDAPPMRTVLSRYDEEMLANDLIEGVRVGHDDMPHFDFNIIATDSLIAYLKSISSDQSQ